MKPEQRLIPKQSLEQERSFTELCVPELMSLANRRKDSVSVLIRDLPHEWSPGDRVLVAVSPSFRKDVEAFYAGKGKCMTEMFEPHQVRSIDKAARVSLRLKLSDQSQNYSD